MRLRHGVGVWETFIPDIGEGEPYKFEIAGADGLLLPLKADPFAFRAELRPANGLGDQRPAAARLGRRGAPGALAGRRGRAASRSASTRSIRARGGAPGAAVFLTWDEMADQMIPYVVDMGFTPHRIHADQRASSGRQLGLPDHRPLCADRPFRRSARLRPLRRRRAPGRYSVSCSTGCRLTFPPTPMASPGSTATALYEHADPREGHHPDWKTAIYNYGRREVAALSDQQRGVLERALSRRRPARGCRRLHALRATIRAPPESGSPTSRVAGRTGRLSASFAG